MAELRVFTGTEEGSRLAVGVDFTEQGLPFIGDPASGVFLPRDRVAELYGHLGRILADRGQSEE